MSSNNKQAFHYMRIKGQVLLAGQGEHSKHSCQAKCNKAFTLFYKRYPSMNN